MTIGSLIASLSSDEYLRTVRHSQIAFCKLLGGKIIKKIIAISLISIMCVWLASAAAESQIAIAEFSSHRVQGNFLSQYGNLNFSAGHRGIEVEIAVVVNKKSLAARFDLKRETADLLADNIVLSKSDKQMLKQVSGAVADYIESEQQGFRPHELLLVQMMGYWSTAPDNHKLTNRRMTNSNGGER